MLGGAGWWGPGLAPLTLVTKELGWLEAVGFNLAEYICFCRYICFFLDFAIWGWISLAPPFPHPPP